MQSLIIIWFTSSFLPKHLLHHIIVSFGIISSYIILHHPWREKKGNGSLICKCDLASKLNLGFLRNYGLKAGGEIKKYGTIVVINNMHKGTMPWLRWQTILQHFEIFRKEGDFLYKAWKEGNVCFAFNSKTVRTIISLHIKKYNTRCNWTQHAIVFT